MLYNRNGGRQTESRLRQMRSILQLTPDSRSRSLETANSGSYLFEDDFESQATSLHNLPASQERLDDVTPSVPVAKGKAPKKAGAKGRTDNRFRKPPLQEEYVNVKTIRKEMNSNQLPSKNIKVQKMSERRGNGKGSPHPQASKAPKKVTEPKKKETEDETTGKGTKARPPDWRNYPKPWLQGISKCHAIKVGAQAAAGTGLGRKQFPPPPSPPREADFILDPDLTASNSRIPLGQRASVQMMIQCFEEQKPPDELDYDDIVENTCAPKGEWRSCDIPVKSTAGYPSNLDHNPNNGSQHSLEETPAQEDLDTILERHMDQNPYSNALFYHQQTKHPESNANTLEAMSPRSETEFRNESEYDENELGPISDFPAFSESEFEGRESANRSETEFRNETEYDENELGPISDFPTFSESAFEGRESANRIPLNGFQRNTKETHPIEAPNTGRMKNKSMSTSRIISYSREDPVSPTVRCDTPQIQSKTQVESHKLI